MAAKGKNDKKPSARGNAMSFPPYAARPMTPRPYGCAPMNRPHPPRPNVNAKVDNKNTKSKKDDPNKKYKLEKEKRIKKGRDYFFVMRKSISFIMFLLCLICVALFAVGYLNMMPQYTSLYVEPDYTPQAEREVELDEEGNPLTDEEGNLIEYRDKSQYYTTVDPIFGFMKKFFNLEIGESPKYDQMAISIETGVADMISNIAMTYYPIALVLFLIVALITMIKAFLGMLGKRIYRLFGLSAFWMLIFALVVVIGGVASNMPPDQNLDFAQIVPFLTATLKSPETPPVTAAGFGLLAMVALPLIILILSIFSKKKIPYSIFD